MFAYDLIKMRRYCTKYVPRNMMYSHMSTKEVGSVDTLHGSMQNIHYDLLCLKETEYTMNIMSDYYGLLVIIVQKVSTRVWE